MHGVLSDRDEHHTTKIPAVKARPPDPPESPPTTVGRRADGARDGDADAADALAPTGFGGPVPTRSPLPARGGGSRRSGEQDIMGGSASATPTAEGERAVSHRAGTNEDGSVP